MVENIEAGGPCAWRLLEYRESDRACVAKRRTIRRLPHLETDGTARSVEESQCKA